MDTKNTFDELENAGVVRLSIIPDESVDIENLKGDCYNPTVNNDIDPAELAEQEREFEDRVYQEGVWGIVGEYRCPHCMGWVHADSVWGFVGDDWKDSGYDTDVMDATIEAYQKAS